MFFSKHVKSISIVLFLLSVSVNATTKKSIPHKPTKAKVETKAPVAGFARSFLTETPIDNAKITILETGETITTNNKGNFQFEYPVGKPLTLILEKEGFHTTQSGTVIVPPKGLIGPYNNITFQVPSDLIFTAFSKAMRAPIDDNQCHVTTTVTAYHKTLDDVPQGEEGAVVVLTPQTNVKPFYFGMFDVWPLKGKTNPFSQDLTQVSKDGGVAFFNLPVSEKPYTVTAKKDGVKFTSAKFLCRKGMFINISPPQGPMAQE